VDVDLILCDACQQVDGKLYILGGGWTHAVVPPEAPVSLALGLIVSVGWNEANRPFDLTVILKDQDGAPVLAGDEDPIRLEGRAEVGRPPGLQPGSQLNTTFAFNFGALPLPANGYVWIVEIDSIEMERKPFWVAHPD